MIQQASLSSPRFGAQNSWRNAFLAGALVAATAVTGGYAYNRHQTHTQGVEIVRLMGGAPSTDPQQAVAEVLLKNVIKSTVQMAYDEHKIGREAARKKADAHEEENMKAIAGVFNIPYTNFWDTADQVLPTLHQKFPESQEPLDNVRFQRVIRHLGLEGENVPNNLPDFLLVYLPKQTPEQLESMLRKIESR